MAIRHSGSGGSNGSIAVGVPGPTGPQGPAGTADPATVLQTGSVTAKDIAVWAGTYSLQDGSNTTGPLLLKTSFGTVAKFQDGGATVANFPIFTAPASGGLTFASSATNGNIQINPNGSGIVKIGGGTGEIDFGTGKVATQVQIGLGTSTWSGAVTPLLSIPQNHAGTITGTQPRYNFVSISSDTADASAASNSVACFSVEGNFGGTGYKGGRTGYLANLGTTTDTSNGCNLIGAELWVNANTNCGGSDTDLNAAGQFYGFNPQAVAGASATNLYILSGGEINVKALSGSSMKAKAGLTIVQQVSDAVQGAVYDAGLGFSNQGAPSLGGAYPIGWNFGIAFGRADGIWPIHATAGAIMGTYNPKTDNSLNKAFGGKPCKYGIDFADIEPTTYSLRLPGISIDPNAVTTIGPMVVTPATTGATIDCSGSYVSAVAVQSGGTAYVAGDHLYDGLGGVYNVGTVSAGVITAISVVNKAYAVSTPSNPVSLSGGHGSSATVNLTWTTSPALSLNLTGDTIVGKQSAKGTTDTTGYMLIPFVSGTPTGVPTNASKGSAVVYDTSAHKLWIYDSGWKSAAFA